MPLKTTVSPRCGSTIGWAPLSERSMIDNRRCPTPTGPRAQSPSPSGPRWAWHAVIRSSAATSARSPSKRTSPASPHTAASPLLGTDDPGVLGAAAARAVDDEAAGGGDAGEREGGQPDVLTAGAGQQHEGAQVDVPRVQPAGVQ